MWTNTSGPTNSPRSIWRTTPPFMKASVPSLTCCRVVIKGPPRLVADVAADRVQPSEQDKAAITCPKTYTDSFQGDATTIYIVISPLPSRQPLPNNGNTTNRASTTTPTSRAIKYFFAVYSCRGHAKRFSFPRTGRYVVLRRSSPVNYVIRLADSRQPMEVLHRPLQPVLERDSRLQATVADDSGSTSDASPASPDDDGPAHMPGRESGATSSPRPPHPPSPSLV